MRLRPGLGDERMLDAAELGEGAEAAVAGVAGVGAAAEVVAHLVAVVRAEEDAEAALLLHFENGLHHLIHRDIALKEVGFVEVAERVAFRRPEVDEVHTVAELAHHRREVVVGPDAEGAGTEIEPVGRIRDGRDEPPASAAEFVQELADKIREIGVGSVVLNRVASENYPNSIREVVLQRSTDGSTWENVPESYGIEELTRQLTEYGERLISRRKRAVTSKKRHSQTFLKGLSMPAGTTDKELIDEYLSEKYGL